MDGTCCLEPLLPRGGKSSIHYMFVRGCFSMLFASCLFEMWRMQLDTANCLRLATCGSRVHHLRACRRLAGRTSTTLWASSRNSILKTMMRPCGWKKRAKVWGTLVGKEGQKTRKPSWSASSALSLEWKTHKSRDVLKTFINIHPFSQLKKTLTTLKQAKPMPPGCQGCESWKLLLGALLWCAQTSGADFWVGRYFGYARWSSLVESVGGICRF